LADGKAAVAAVSVTASSTSPTLVPLRIVLPS
jgi:hypothetical protein